MNKNPTSAEEQYKLGNAYYLGGDNILKDIREAIKWYTKAAEQGHIEAMMYLGHIYDLGPSYGIYADLEKAIHWYTKAAKQGNIKAQYELGWIYSKPGSEVKDYEKAVYWYKKAAEQGCEYAQNSLGFMYKEGKGVSKDKEMAKFWYAQAAAQGSESAQKSLKELNRRGCYVATCIYGSYDCPEVWTLRRYRDTKLSKSWFGRLFIQIYYATSPKIVELSGNRKWFNRLLKPILNKLVSKLQNNSVDSSPYSDL